MRVCETDYVIWGLMRGLEKTHMGNGQTNRRTDRRTLQLYDWPCPEGRVSDNSSTKRVDSLFCPWKKSTLSMMYGQTDRWIVRCRLEDNSCSKLFLLQHEAAEKYNWEMVTTDKPSPKTFSYHFLSKNNDSSGKILIICSNLYWTLWIVRKWLNIAKLLLSKKS